MTLREHKELSNQERGEVARLMRLHLETHPARVALLYGISAQYVRRLWREFLTSEMSTTHQAFIALHERLTPVTRSIPDQGSRMPVKR